MTVIQGDPELAVRERLDDLAVELDLLFLAGHLPACWGDVGRFGTLLALTDLEFDLRALGKRLEALTRDARVMNEDILVAVVRRDEAVALRVVEPLNGSSCHRETPPSQPHEREEEALSRLTTPHALLYA